MSLAVKRTIAVQAIVTEELKQELRAELEEAIQTTQRRIDQMDFQSRRFLADLQRTDLSQAMSARRQIEAEKRRHEALVSDLRKQLEEAEKLELGTEFARGSLEGTVELSEGDDLFKKLSGCQVVIKDGVIVEVREA
jgi:Na+/phosphate symporter